MQAQEFNEMAHRILDAGELLTQTRGFNAFSYKDIQEKVGVKTSSIHYYFPTKQDLAHAMVRRYIDRFISTLDEIDSQKATPYERLKAMGQIFVDVAKAEKLCLCGMLISDIKSIPQKAIQELRRFFKKTEHWAAKTIRQGTQDGCFKTTLEPDNAAAHFMATMEGAVLVSRIHKKTGYMKNVLRTAMSQVTP